jgi:predicted kinase
MERILTSHIIDVISSLPKEKPVVKELFLLRGLPGSGKSTLAKSIGGIHIEADMYFMKDGEYQFDVTRLKDAHQWCQEGVEKSMSGLNNPEITTQRIIVSNTFTQEWEMKSYYDLAQKHGYKAYSLIVENRHGGVNEHGVPEEKLEQMKNRFEIKL